VDTPAASLGTDGPVTASRCGAALIVARRDKSRLDAIENLARTVSIGSAQLVGSVINEF
jgi:protein-tyrosine kinase